MGRRPNKKNRQPMEIKATLRVPTADPYAYIELEQQVESAEAAVEAYNEVTQLVKGGNGLPEKEWRNFLDNMLLGESNLVDTYEQTNQEQRKIINEVKKALKRLEAREKNLEARENNHV